eukprot:115037-Rhodomonas_salina.1
MIAGSVRPSAKRRPSSSFRTPPEIAITDVRLGHRIADALHNSEDASTCSSFAVRAVCCVQTQRQAITIQNEGPDSDATDLEGKHVGVGEELCEVGVHFAHELHAHVRRPRAKANAQHASDRHPMSECIADVVRGR